MDIEKVQQEVNIQVNEEMTTSNYRAYDFRLVRYIGLEPAILLTYLCDQDKFINKRNVGSEFYKQKKFIEFFTGLTSKQQTLAIKKLKQLELIDVIKKGMPAKNYFKIDYNKVREMKKIVVDEFYGEIEKYNYYEHEFDTDEEILEQANEKSVKKELSSEPETGSQENLKDSDINNKEINNLDTYNKLSKDNSIIGVHAERGTHLAGEDNSKNNNIKKNESMEEVLEEVGKTVGPDGIEVFSNQDSLVEVPKTAAASPEPKKKGKGGLAPLYDLVDERIPGDKYPTINIGCKTYLKAHIGIRRLPSVEKWSGMLDFLINESSISINGTSGKKIVPSKAIAILEKAINGKDGVPYLDFDKVDGGLMEPTVETNQRNNTGY